MGVLSLYHTLPKKGPSERTVRRILKRAGRFYRPASERRRILINRRVGWSIPVFAGAVALLLLFILPRIRTRDIAYDFEGKVWSMSQEIILMTESVSLDSDIDSRIDGLVSELSFIEEEW